ncbi:dihydrodipicolinate synthase family protein [Adhaeretor mobilis]|uniref:4-hydroxy-tetrahydrodipicolinate synthase n=1 Tax=Adhaeretor mobilis TaxID=1930276 RepID=A0A517MWP4_9BACT|nr:dihydrodipicolinate synthase family protein [Adhaeretor mobilis]QDS99303.1 4-hydroxy-tetrahydrodipicolinate synthase [Adhaeretor mobilis]
MVKPHLVSAICTPLTEDEDLHYEGLAIHLEHQLEGQIDGVLVAGTMGLLQLLKDSTYEQLVKASAEYYRGQGELLIGVGDTSYERTKERIQLVNHEKVDGTVVLAPYFIKLSQRELCDYFVALANISRAPLFLYDLPQRTGTQITFETVAELSRHPNIAGIKCSGELVHARRVHDAFQSSSFRVLIAQPMCLDMLVGCGLWQHLDGIFSISPQWARDTADASMLGDKEKGAAGVQQINELINLLVKYDVFPTASFLLGKLGVPGNFLPRPLAGLTIDQEEKVMQEAIVQELLSPTPESIV